MEKIHLRKVRYALVAIQIAILAGAFFLFFGVVAMTLYLASEINLAEVAEFMALAGTWEGVSVITFFQGLGYVFWKKHRQKKAMK